VSTVPDDRSFDADLTDLDLFADGLPHAVFARHRVIAPVSWHEPTAHAPDGEGFWSVATHAEALVIMRDPRTYSSETGGGDFVSGVAGELPMQAICLLLGVPRATGTRSSSGSRRRSTSATEKRSRRTSTARNRA
jgi:cytochrome P450